MGARSTQRRAFIAGFSGETVKGTAPARRRQRLWQLGTESNLGEVECGEAAKRRRRQALGD
jgi:hypothetical protein